MDELEIARVRAYAATPAGMPAVRYTGGDQPTNCNIEILRLTLANGAEGIATFDSGWDGAEGGDVVRDIAALSTRVIGQSAARRIALTESFLADAGEGPWEAISLIDCAMWDAWAQTEGKPLWQLLGGYQESIEAYASTVTHPTVEHYLRDVEHYAGLGYRAIKFHVSGSLDFDLEMVRAVARAHGDSKLRFMVDLEECYSFEDAVSLGEALSDLSFDWMEAPLPDVDLDAYVELNRIVGVDVLPAGNTVLGLENWTDGLRRGAWSRLRFDATNAGGVTESLKALQLAQMMDVPVELQSFGFQPTQHVNLHLMLGLAGCTWFEHPVPHEPYNYATRNPLTLDPQGRVSAANGPGLGLDVDWDLIAADAFVMFDSLA